MTTTADRGTGTRTDRPTPREERRGPRHSVNWIRRFVGAVVILGVLALLTYGAVTQLGDKLGADPVQRYRTHTVQRSELLVTVTEDGNLESASNLEIRCQVAGGSSILWIVKDGSVVKKGDKLVELDAAALEDQINQQKIAYEKARSAMIQAEKDFEVAKISVQEYLEGTYMKAMQDADAQIQIAMENLRSAENMLEHSRRMFRKGYISHLELEGQQFAVERAKLELLSANTAKEVLEKFTKVKTLEDLQSQRDTAEAKMQSERAAFELEQARLQRLEAQLANCIITAPQDGMVVYANDTNRRFGQQGASIEEGAQVRERQAILRLPDLTQMQVKVNVHESKVDMLRPGMRARIRILDDEYLGTVASIANQPEPSSWFSADVKEYATQVRIAGEQSSLKPGMTALVEILVAHLQDVVTVPVASVLEQNGQFFCWVKKGEGVERRPITIGLTNDKFIEVREGLEEGDQIVLNPRAVVEEARSMSATTEPMDVTEKFGSSESAATGGAPAGGAGAAPAAGRGAGPAAGGAGAGPAAGGLGAGGPGADEPGAGPAPGGPGAAGSGGGGRRGNLADLDTDGDGKISRDEAPERMQQFFDRVDTDGDGFIDSAEQAAMRARFQGGGGGGPGGPGGGPGGPGGGPGGGGGAP